MRFENEEKSVVFRLTSQGLRAAPGRQSHFTLASAALGVANAEAEDADGAQEQFSHD